MKSFSTTIVLLLLSSSVFAAPARPARALNPSNPSNQKDVSADGSFKSCGSIEKVSVTRYFTRVEVYDSTTRTMNTFVIVASEDGYAALQDTAERGRTGHWTNACFTSYKPANQGVYDVDEIDL